MARRPSTMRMGPASLFALIIILCLAVLAVLSASAANASSAMAHRQADFLHDDYVNESVGQALFAQADDIAAGERDAGGEADAVAWALEDALDQLSAGASADALDDSAPSVSLSLDGYELSAHLQAASGRCLDIVWEILDDGTLSPVSWKATTAWTEDTTDVLWTGGD